jgi:hypothetical protein
MSILVRLSAQLSLTDCLRLRGPPGRLVEREVAESGLEPSFINWMERRRSGHFIGQRCESEVWTHHFIVHGAKYPGHP